MMAKGVFITGTDTGVGKTMIAAGILRALMRNDIKAGAMKPIETGCVRTGDRGQVTGDLIPADALFLSRIAGMDDPVNVVAPVRFAHPLAPMVASELEGKPVDLETLFHSFAALVQKYEFLVVEGAGGLMVPIKMLNGSSTYYMADLIKELDFPAVIVARAGLGAINHTLLTVTHAIGKGIGVRGVIINSTGPAGNAMAERTNPGVLQRICPVPVLGIVPYYNAPYDIIDAVADALKDVVASLMPG